MGDSKEMKVEFQRIDWNRLAEKIEALIRKRMSYFEKREDVDSIPDIAGLLQDRTQIELMIQMQTKPKMEIEGDIQVPPSEQGKVAAKIPKEWGYGVDLTQKSCCDKLDILGKKGGIHFHNTHVYLHIGSEDYEINVCPFCALHVHTGGKLIDKKGLEGNTI